MAIRIEGIEDNHITVHSQNVSRPRSGNILNKGKVYSERWNKQNKTLFIETVELAEGVIVRESRGDL